MNAFNIAPVNDDLDLQHVNPAFPKVAGGLTLLAAVLAMVNGIQTLALVRLHGPWSLVPYALIVLGIALGYFAKNVFTARSWAAMGVLVTGALVTLASTAWLVFSMMNGWLSAYAVWTPAGAVVAVIMCAIAIPACDRATSARRRLAAQGMSLGL